MCMLIQRCSQSMLHKTCEKMHWGVGLGYGMEVLGWFNGVGVLGWVD